jgi:putative PIN family toxin of toxin-antitoxin system
MRVVADTNIVVSGLLWYGPSRRVLAAAGAGQIDLFTSAVLLAQLEEVLQRKKFARRLELVGLMPHDLTLGYAALATLVEPAVIAPIVLDDPDDDEVLACAVGARAEAIVSGDRHLLEMNEYQSIPILTATELLARIPS